MQHNNQENSLDIVKQMTDWINYITIIDKTHEEGYHIVCKQYNNFIGRLNQSKSNKQSNEDKDSCIAIINKLHEGINTCQYWFCVEDTMNHFQELKQTITRSKIILESTNINNQGDSRYVMIVDGNKIE